MDKNWNSIFAILAMQLKRVSGNQIAEAEDTSSEDSQPSLPDRLVRVGALHPKDAEMLVELADELVTIHGADTKLALESIGGLERLTSHMEPERSGDTPTSFPETPMDGTPFGNYRRLMESEPIEELPGRYTHISEQGKGGMGRVLVVHDLTMGRDVALKELMPFAGTTKPSETGPVRTSAALVARFLQEGRVTAGLERPSIVPVYELGRRPNGSLYYTMKLVRGRTLSKALRACSDLEQRLALLPHFTDLCQAIAYAHDRGVLHRDIKPSNVMVGEFGETVVLDWGIAKVKRHEEDIFEKDIREMPKLLDEGIDLPPETAYGAVMGTPDYMSPEQANGLTEIIDERSDVYSLGVVLYQVLTGKRPFQDDSPRAVLHRVRTEAPPSVSSREPDVEPELASICEKAMHPDRDRRYASVKELVDEIQRYQTGALVRVYRYGLSELAKRFYAKHRAVVNTVAVAMLVVLALGVFSYIQIYQARDREHEQRLVAEKQNYIAQMHLVNAYMNDNQYALANETLDATSEYLRGWEWGYLTNRCNLDLFTLPDCMDMAFSPAGGQVATISKTEPPRIWNALTGEALRDLGTAPPQLLDVRFSPDGKRLLAPGLDRTVHVWDVSTGDLVARLEGHTGAITKAFFHQSADQIVTASSDGTVRVWNVQTQSEEKVFDASPASASSAEITADNQYVVARLIKPGAEGAYEPEVAEVKVWRMADGQEHVSVPGTVHQLSHDETLIAAAYKTDAAIFSLADGKTTAALRGHTALVKSVGFSPDGQFVATGSRDTTARVYEVATGRLAYTVAHNEPVTHVSFSPNGVLLMTVSRKGAIDLWDASTGTPLNSLRGHESWVREAVFSPDSTRVASASFDQTVRMWNAVDTPGHITVARAAAGIKSAAISGHGTRAALVLANRTLEIRDTHTGSVVAAFAACAPHGGHAVALTNDGRYVAAVLDHFTPIVWDVESRTVVSAFTGHRGQVHAIGFSGAGERVATGSWDNTARIWDARTAQEMVVLEGHTDSVACVAFSPDSMRVATGSEDNTARIWDAATGRELLVLTGHDDGVADVTFNADGALLATASEDKTVRVWNTATGVEQLVLAGHGSTVWDVRFSEDARRLVTASGDGRMRLWDGSTGSELLSIARPRGFIMASFLPEPTALLSACGDGTVQGWQATPWAADLSDLPSRTREAAQGHALTADAPEELTVATTRHAIVVALSQLAEVLEVEPAQSAIIVDGSVYDALARLCFLRGDQLSAIEGVVLTPPNDASAVLREHIERIEAGALSAPSFDVVRTGASMRLTCVTVPRIELRREVAIAAPLVIELIEAHLNELAEDGPMAIEINQEFAARLGESATTPDGLNGIWLTRVESQEQKNYHLHLGLANGDRMVSIQGRAITSMDILHEEYQKALEQLRQGTEVQFSIVIERGAFQEITLATP